LKRPEEELALLRSFTLVCPFCENFYPFPEDIEEVYRCRCGAVFKIAWRSDMEEAVNQLATSFLSDEDNRKDASGDNVFCQAVIYEDIENIMRMKREYEAHQLLRWFQGFDRDYLQKLVLVWLGSEGRMPQFIDS
jgi:hypothetical protein